MQLLWQVLFNGIGIGGIYCLVAVGLQLVAGVIRIPNFATGQYYMLSAYAVYFLLDIGIGYFPSVLFAVLIIGGIGVISEKIIVEPLLERPMTAGLLSTLGLALILEGLALTLFGSFPRSVITPYSETIIRIGDVYFSQQRLMVILGGIGAFISTDFFIMKTKVGKALRAMAQNKEACKVFGIDIYKMGIISFTIGVALAGFAAALVAPLVSICPSLGSLVLFKAFAVIIMTGVGHFRGLIISATLLGLGESLGAAYVDPLLKDAIALLLMTLILLVRPQGLFGEKIELLFRKQG